MRILVAGGTGMLGLPVVRALAQAGHGVRVLTRDPARGRAILANSAEILGGDVTRPASLAAAVEGCEAIHVSLRGADDWNDYRAVEDRGLHALLSAARDAGVAHVTYLSGAGRIENNEELPTIAIKLAAERTIRESGIPFTIFRATHFMESLDLFIARGDATIIGDQPHRYHYVAASDFADLVLRALATPQARRRTLYVFGPQAYTMEDALHRYVKRLHPQARIRHLPVGAAKFLGFVTRNRRLAFAAQLFESFSRIGEAGDPSECQALLGMSQTTLETWLEGRRRAA